MPAPKHYRLTFSGTLGSGTAPEIFSVNLSAGFPGMDGVRTDGLVDLATGLKADWDLGLKNIPTGQALLTRVRAAVVDATGHVQRDANGAYQQGDWVGASSRIATPYVPPQVALTCSLHSSAAGSTGRGRIYMPVPAYGTTIDTEGLVSTAQRDTWQTALITSLNAMNTRLTTFWAPAGGPTRIVVASAGSVTKGVAPALRTINRVSIGRVLDTQRRRRNSLLESRVFSALA